MKRSAGVATFLPSSLSSIYTCSYREGRVYANRTYYDGFTVITNKDGNLLRRGWGASFFLFVYFPSSFFSPARLALHHHFDR